MKFPPGLLRRQLLHLTRAHLLPPQTTTYITSPTVGPLTATHLSDAQPLGYLIIIFRDLMLSRQPYTLG